MTATGISVTTTPEAIAGIDGQPFLAMGRNPLAANNTPDIAVMAGATWRHQLTRDALPTECA